VGPEKEAKGKGEHLINPVQKDKKKKKKTKKQREWF